MCSALQTSVSDHTHSVDLMSVHDTDVCNAAHMKYTHQVCIMCSLLMRRVCLTHDTDTHDTDTHDIDTHDRDTHDTDTHDRDTHQVCIMWGTHQVCIMCAAFATKSCVIHDTDLMSVHDTDLMSATLTHDDDDCFYYFQK